MIFFFCGRPSALFNVPDELHLVSFALEPEWQKNTLEIGIGAISFSFSASSIAGRGCGRRTDAEGQLAHLLACGLDQLSLRIPSAVHHRPAMPSMIGLPCRS
jgi:hypothetical protein